METYAQYYMKNKIKCRHGHLNWKMVKDSKDKVPECKTCNWRAPILY